MRYLIAAILGLLLLAGGYFWIMRPGGGEGAGIKSQEKNDFIAESTELVTVTGTKKTFRDYRGQVVLVNFWASWCAPCIREMPSIYKIYDKFKKRGFQVVAVNMDDESSEGVSFLKQKVGAPPFELYQGVESQIFALFGLRGLPHSALIDKQGRIAFSHAGELDWMDPKLIGLIEGLL